MPYRPRWVQALGAYIDAILNTVAAEDTEGVVQLGQPFVGRVVPAIRQEAISLQQPRGPDESIRVPPKRWTSR